MKFSTVLPYLLYQFKNEHELVKAIEELSHKFTKEREKIGDYLKDERLTSAYAAFYLTTNIPKLQSVFQWMPSEWLEELKNCELVDLGAGPGTFSLAFREWLGNKVQGIIQIETSSLMREQAQKLWDGLYPGEELTQSFFWKSDKKQSRFLLFGHSANEIGVEGSLKYIRDISPDHILFIEPGTKEYFPKMLEIRKALIEAGYHILFPCPLDHECPLKGSQNDWCHQFIQVKQEMEIERLSQMAKKDRRHLPLIVHAFSKTFKSENPSTRLVRVFPETKFSFEWEVCEFNQIERFQIMKRDLDRTTVKKLEETLAGAPVKAEVEKVLEKSKRVKIT